MSDTERYADVERAERVKSWHKGKKQGPLTLEISPTFACNVNCRFCRRKDELAEHYKHEKDLSDDQWVGIVERALALGTRKILLRGGGDPLLRRSLLRKLFPLAARTAEAEFTILTNGTLIDERLAEGFADCGWTEVSVSLHGGTPAVHDYVTDQPGSFAAVKRSLDNLARARKGRRRPWVTFHCVVTRRSCREIDALIDFAAAHGVQHVGLFPMHNPPYPQHVTELTMRPEDERDFQALVPGYVARLKAAGIDHCVQLSYQGTNNELSSESSGELPKDDTSEHGKMEWFRSLPAGQGPASLPCYFPWHHATITAEGAMAPCCYGENKRRGADLHEVSFDAAWLGGDMGHYRELMKGGEVADFCAKCPNWYQRDNERLRPLVESGA